MACSPGRPQLLKKLRFGPEESPLIAQIWGKDPENFYKTARELSDGTFARELGLPKYVNFAGIDLNMGCPDKTVVKNGACSALIINRPLAQEIISATKAGAGTLPVSVKTRLGFNTIDLSWMEFLLGQDIAMLAVHGRTRKEMSNAPVHWGEIAKVREIRDSIAPQTLLVGNGDILSRHDGLVAAETYGLDGVMIGRGIFHDPFVFAEHSPWSDYTKAQKLALFSRHLQLFAETWQSGERPVIPLYKFCKIYLNGFGGAKELRDHFTRLRTIEDMLAFASAA